MKFRFFPEGKYIVLDTDYDNYAIIYNCDDWFFGFTRTVWLLSRTPRIDDTYVTAAKALIEKKVGKNSGSTNPYNLEGQWRKTFQGGWCRYGLGFDAANESRSD